MLANTVFEFPNTTNDNLISQNIFLIMISILPVNSELTVIGRTATYLLDTYRCPEQCHIFLEQ